LGGSVAYFGTPLLEKPPAGIIGLAGAYRFEHTSHYLKGPGKLIKKIRERRETKINPVIPISLIGKAITKPLFITNKIPLKGVLWPWLAGNFEDDLARERMTKGFDAFPWRVLASMMLCAVGDCRDEDGTDYLELHKRSQTPLLITAADQDQMLPIAAVRSAYDESTAPDKEFVLFGKESCGVSFGHIDLVLGKHSPAHVWPKLLDWMDIRSQRPH
jgi:hypothetical protein